MSDTCIFCKIIAGEIPSTILHEDDMAIVFMDINQSQKGHLLIVPKVHVAEWHDLEDDAAAQIALLAVRWAKPTMRAVSSDGYNLVVNNGGAAGQEVMHVHLHIIPRWQGDGFIKLGVPTRFADATELKGTADAIRAAKG